MKREEELVMEAEKQKEIEEENRAFEMASRDSKARLSKKSKRSRRSGKESNRRSIKSN